MSSSSSPFKSRTWAGRAKKALYVWFLANAPSQNTLNTSYIANINENLSCRKPYSTPESATLTQVGETWVGSRYHFYADEDTTFTDEETGEQVDINSDDIEDNLPVGATLTMRDKYTSVTVRRTGERSYNINGYETDHSGAPYDAQDALDFIFKWYGATTRHTITRP